MTTFTLDALKAYCTTKPEVTFDFPFDETTLVFRVCNKMFLLTGVDNPVVSINVKCDPELALTLRATYPAITPGYHMNKKHWNTILLDGSVPDDEVWGMIDHSYDRVVKTLTKAQRAKLNL